MDSGRGVIYCLNGPRGGARCKFPSTRARWFRKARNNARPLPIVSRLFISTVALLAARNATAFLSTPPPPFNPGQRCKVDRCAHDSSRLVNHRRRGGSQASFSSARGLIELKTRRGKILKFTSLVAPTHRYLSRFLNFCNFLSDESGTI